MELSLELGGEALLLRGPDRQFISTSQSTLQSHGSAIELARTALAKPLRFPPFHQALTPDDHIAIIIQPPMPGLPDVLAAIGGELSTAGIVNEHVTLVLPPNSEAMTVERPAGFALETHDPSNARKHSYLAATPSGRRIYVNRTVVDADQVVVVGELRYQFGGEIMGGTPALFPMLSNEATRTEFRGLDPEKAAEETKHVCWLLGLPFFVTVIADATVGVATIIAGPDNTLVEARAAMESIWQVSVPKRADLVIATITGDQRTTTEELASAAASAVRVVRKGGKVVLVCDRPLRLGPSFSAIVKEPSPVAAAKILTKGAYSDRLAAAIWLQAVREEGVYLICNPSGDLAQQLFAKQLDPRQLQNFVQESRECLVLQGANRVCPVLAKE